MHKPTQPDQFETPEAIPGIDRRRFLQGLLGAAAIGSMGAGATEAKETVPEDFAAFATELNAAAKEYFARRMADPTSTQASAAAKGYELGSRQDTAAGVIELGTQLKNKFPELAEQFLAFGRDLTQNEFNPAMQRQWLDRGYYFCSFSWGNPYTKLPVLLTAREEPTVFDLYQPLETFFSPEELRSSLENTPVIILGPEEKEAVIVGMSDVFGGIVYNPHNTTIQDICPGQRCHPKELFATFLLNEAMHHTIRKILDFDSSTNVFATYGLMPGGNLNQAQAHEFLSDAASMTVSEYQIGSIFWNMFTDAKFDLKKPGEITFDHADGSSHQYELSYRFMLDILHKHPKLPEIQKELKEFIAIPKKDREHDDLVKTISRIQSEYLTLENRLAIRKAFINQGVYLLSAIRAAVAEHRAKHDKPEQK